MFKNFCLAGFKFYEQLKRKNIPLNVDIEVGRVYKTKQGLAKVLSVYGTYSFKVIHTLRFFNRQMIPCIEPKVFVMYLNQNHEQSGKEMPMETFINDLESFDTFKKELSQLDVNSI